MVTRPHSYDASLQTFDESHRPGSCRCSRNDCRHRSRADRCRRRREGRLRSRRCPGLSTAPGGWARRGSEAGHGRTLVGTAVLHCAHAFSRTTRLSRVACACAWDAFGIPAALRQNAAIDGRCAWSGDPLAATVTHGRVRGSGLIHLEVPARRFWDDIFYT